MNHPSSPLAWIGDCVNGMYEGLLGFTEEVWHPLGQMHSGANSIQQKQRIELIDSCADRLVRKQQFNSP